MAELQIELKLSLQIPENGLSINNVLYQLRKFMAKLFFAIFRSGRIPSELKSKGPYPEDLV